MSNSPLVSYTRISPNRTSPRNHSIDRITIHCVVGQVTVERLGEIFAPESRKASANYGIGKDGKIGMYVEEKDRSWCSSNRNNDHRAVTIEVASDTTHPYAVTDEAYNALLDLCADICRRNGKSKLLWMEDEWTALSYQPAADEMVMTVHRWFANKACPGQYLLDRHGDIAEEVTRRLREEDTLTQDQFDSMMDSWLARRAALPASDWAVPYIEKAIDAGLMTEVNGSIERPQDFVTREELATVAAALSKK